MSELSILTSQRDELLRKIRGIEENCEGIENEHNASRVQALNLEQVKLAAQRSELVRKLTELDHRLSVINSEISKLSGTGIDRILDAIKNQKWFYFKNKPKVLMDKSTGLLWANLDYFPYRENNLITPYSLSDATKVISGFDFDGIAGFGVPDCYELWNMAFAKDFPFSNKNCERIKDIDYWAVNHNGLNYSKDLDDAGALSDISSSRDVSILPCSGVLVKGSDYEKNVSANNSVYSEKERLQFTLDLFVQNKLWPVFNDDEITQLYHKIYFEKPMLLRQLEEVQAQIESLQTVSLLSSEFDYTLLLEKYDLKAIDHSVIQYYQAVQKWTDELMEKLDTYEHEKEAVINDFNMIGLKLAKKYEPDANLTDRENSLLEERQAFFRKKLSLGMNRVKSKILAVKKQADELENRIDEIDNGSDAIHELAVLEREERAGFSFIAENTAKMIRNALQKIEYFESHHQFVMSAVDIWEKWSEDYRIFKTVYREDFKKVCEEDGIEEELWLQWYLDWQQLRFAVEQKVQPMIERGLKGDIDCAGDAGEQGGCGIVGNIIQVLKSYRDSVDKFYLEERKGIYQKYAFQSGGELQDKFETEASLYRYAAEFQSNLQEIIFNCKNAEDRIFILNWSSSLLDIQIDEILGFVADHDLQKISKSILQEFAALKLKNYDVYLADAKAYGMEKAAREKQYNSLIYKMRKDLMK
ncbi:hypothetical protein GPL15_15240 [Clostridium sp. MCC353]|uniref:hypothetical protein n=1 Tax=Clostridium sp. MCC353 TaxID=2592646 RepID=UPI001C0210AB|nr:hypothetical protein [Clostridium sp. MCC353]MBT9777856.1 hypothetical protein [Clostridium sp. MCC353]